ncbi:hypothetical protein [Portibacter marinus]|uniref:hypothetical protein n=1 Tax=Portibacter marinus TaxID=2898660 RepID=UPI001F1BBB1B|nr:hypothetical protein [Portibacter marinus]
MKKTLAIIFSAFIVFSSCHSKIDSISLHKFEKHKSISIRLDGAKVVDKNGIGDEWSFMSKVNEIELRRGVSTSISLNGRSLIELVSIAVEDDPSSDDVGEDILSITP